MDEDAADRLARAVRERRKELGLSQSQLHGRGGPSGPTLVRIEHAEVPLPGPVTLAKLDRALGWTPGSANAVVEDGTEPNLSEQQPWIPGRGSTTVPITVVTDLIGVADRIGQLAEDTSTTLSELRHRLRAAQRDLAVILHPIYGAYLTHLLERNRRDGAADLNPLVPVFEQLLRTSESTEDIGERQYRRWLVGMFEPDEETKQRFHARWKAATTQ
ncbi:helix-turn-helix domain-containing protein [Hoyosella subflava]|uniref:HTH cro/C1-type domain-containing protein n=1 Tax=Hoyosella subflava (strain DSM 45089 / JCM 17490 / NBRC 109087 / DQS3-9A1) TaxID=443218 RepID=F6ESH2_HOYSD|nr:helix-turn-helix transcriptional regulator [Hoyosella subflava]AEF43093.1 hypothetical protein AS9A_P20049 [Hoyosella subflava DQS3-9A1]